MNALDKLVKAGKAAMAGRTLAYARAAFRWAEKRGKVPANPFQGLPISAGTSARERVLSDGELTEAWEAAGRLGYPWGPFFRLAMLTLQRREEVAGMRWSELAPDLSLWTIPGARMKNGKPHDVHLSDAARAVLRDIPRIDGCDFVLSTTGKTPVSGFSKAKAALDAAIVKARAEIRGRGEAQAGTVGRVALARSAPHRGVSHGAARLRFDRGRQNPRTPAGKTLGVAGVYQRHDFVRERAAALDAWAAHVTGQVTENVIPLRSASR